jgi:replicative DNA helicase
MQDNLSEYGHTFQTKVISSLISDRGFLQQTSDLLEPAYFESQANNWLVDKILKYHTQYKSAPTPEVFKSLLVPVEDKLLRTSIVDGLKEALRLQNSPDLEYVKNETIEFCKNQKMKVAILESVDLLKAGKFDAIKKKVDSALKAGADKDVGHEYKDQIEERYSEGARNCVATNWDVINDIMSGGLAGGELGVVVAPAGGGKSWGLINVAANAVKQGKTVIYYTLELNAFYVGRRIDAYLTKIPFQNLQEEHSRERIQEAMEGLTGNLIIKYYPTRTASINTITSHIEKCISQGKKPDMIVLDYADLIRPSKAGDKRLELNDIYEDLRGVAGEYDIPIWTASQANRSATEEDVIEGNKVSESYNKVMVCDFIMSLSRKLNDKIGGTGRWHIIKNRFGPDGMTFPSKINTMTGHIEIFEPNSDIGKSVSDSMKGETMVKKALSQKFKELEGF